MPLPLLVSLAPLASPVLLLLVPLLRAGTPQRVFTTA
jgi:hypothetical protein